MTHKKEHYYLWLLYEEVTDHKKVASTTIKAFFDIYWFPNGWTLADSPYWQSRTLWPEECSLLDHKMSLNPTTLEDHWGQTQEEDDGWMDRWMDGWKVSVMERLYVFLWSIYGEIMYMCIFMEVIPLFNSTLGATCITESFLFSARVWLSGDHTLCNLIVQLPSYLPLTTQGLPDLIKFQWIL